MSLYSLYVIGLQIFCHNNREIPNTRIRGTLLFSLSFYLCFVNGYDQEHVCKSVPTSLCMCIWRPGNNFGLSHDYPLVGGKTYYGHGLAKTILLIELQKDPISPALPYNGPPPPQSFFCRFWIWELSLWALKKNTLSSETPPHLHFSL